MASLNPFKPNLAENLNFSSAESVATGSTKPLATLRSSDDLGVNAGGPEGRTLQINRATRPDDHGVWIVSLSEYLFTIDPVKLRGFGVDEFRRPYVIASGCVERARANHYRICGGSQKTHYEAIPFFMTADLPAAGIPGNLIADDAVECGNKVSDSIRPILKSRSETKITAVMPAKFRWQHERANRLSLIKQRSN
jgi:hypothetical protein